MYAPSHYTIKDQEQLLSFIKEFPFAVFILKEEGRGSILRVRIKKIFQLHSTYVYVIKN